MPHPPDAPMPARKLNRLGWYGSGNTDWGAWPPREEDHVDVRTANYGIGFLQQDHDRPFFLGIGIFRPHMPFFSPQRILDSYPLEKTVMPEIKQDDGDDLPSGAASLLKSKKWFWQGMARAERERPGTWREAVRAYQAAATFADEQIGRVLDASPYRGDDPDPHEWTNLAGDPSLAAVLREHRDWLEVLESPKRSRHASRE